MSTTESSTFKAPLLRPATGTDDWSFVVLPKTVSDRLPRRGRTTVDATINGHDFQAMLEPDGQLSHWLKVDEALCDAAGISAGDTVTVRIEPASREAEPTVPADLKQALAASAAATATWQDTTTIARVDWIHWVESAKQAKTRQGRVEKACDMLGAGKRRVCCFDPSGFYSKSLSAPEAAP